MIAYYQILKEQNTTITASNRITNLDFIVVLPFIYGGNIRKKADK
jgi:hypothetical protein